MKFDENNDILELGGHKFSSRFILGSGKFSLPLLEAAVHEAGAQIVTLALRRVNEGGLENILDFIPKGVTLLPNTSGARNADECARIAKLAREAGCGDLVKVEVIRDSKYLLPDNYETIKATDLASAGAACVMPLGAPIGTNKGLCTREFIKILLDEIDLPVIVDAGIGTPAQACEAMQMGCAAVMANTAIATAGDVKTMARAFALAIHAGRLAYLSGLGGVSESARASSPLTGFLE